MWGFFFSLWGRWSPCNLHHYLPGTEGRRGAWRDRLVHSHDCLQWTPRWNRALAKPGSVTQCYQLPESIAPVPNVPSLPHTTMLPTPPYWVPVPGPSRSCHSRLSASAEEMLCLLHFLQGWFKHRGFCELLVIPKQKPSIRLCAFMTVCTWNVPSTMW